VPTVRVLCAALRVDEQPANDRNGVLLRGRGFFARSLASNAAGFI
jgi:hypothetical protein